MWSVPKQWDEPCFIIAGGPSVLSQDLSSLRGRRVIAINSSAFTYPEADFVFFGDSRWWRAHRSEVAPFAGRMVTASVINVPGVLRLRKLKPPGLTKDRGSVTMRHTSLHGAINFAVHLGARVQVLLGADGKLGSDGRTHHHVPHEWKPLPGCWDRQKEDLATTLKALRLLGVTVLNASPGSAWGDLWPIVTLEQAIAFVDQQRLAA